MVTFVSVLVVVVVVVVVFVCFLFFTGRTDFFDGTHMHMHVRREGEEGVQE